MTSPRFGRISRSSPNDPTADRWSIWTTPPRPKKPKAVIDLLVHAYEHEYANVHRGLHYLANAATEAYEAARESVRRFLNAASTDEIVFTRSATEAINLAAASYGLKNIGPGDEIVLSVMEHHSNIVPWHFHRERKGAILRWVEVGDDGSFSTEGFRAGAERPDEDRRDHPIVECPGVNKRRTWSPPKPSANSLE